MDRYATGDGTAFAEVYDRLAPRLHAFLLRQTRDRAHTDDLVQQTFLHMHCSRETYVTGADVLPWAFAIARRLAIDAYRRHKREVVEDHPDLTLLLPALPQEDALRTKQAARALQAQLDALPDSQRVAFELVKLDGLSLAQAAETLGTTVTAVKLRTHRAYQALRGVVDDGMSRRAVQR